MIQDEQSRHGGFTRVTIGLVTLVSGKSLDYNLQTYFTRLPHHRLDTS